MRVGWITPCFVASHPAFASAITSAWRRSESPLLSSHQPLRSFPVVSRTKKQFEMRGQARQVCSMQDADALVASLHWRQSRLRAHACHQVSVGRLTISRAQGGEKACAHGCERGKDIAGPYLRRQVSHDLVDAVGDVDGKPGIVVHGGKGSMAGKVEEADSSSQRAFKVVARRRRSDFCRWDPSSGHRMTSRRRRAAAPRHPANPCNRPSVAGARRRCLRRAVG